MTTCSKCRSAEPAPGQRYCLDCKAAYMREWRPKHPLVGKAKQKDTARTYANVYFRRGKVERQDCAVCGCSDSQMHHPDHELPLQVTWLCRPCHLAWHAFWRRTVLSIFDSWVKQANSEIVTRRTSEAA